MNTSNLLDTKTHSFNNIIQNGNIYIVPHFQRDYSWTEDNWEDLWTDIITINENKESHYMGSIVLLNKGNSNYHIIDGQQRFTTLSIISLAVITKLKELVSKGIEKEENTERIELLMKEYIGQKDSVSLTYSSKLFLNENNDSFYQRRLLSFSEPINVKKLLDSEKLLWKAYMFFVNKINELSQNINTGSELASFLKNTVGKNLLFIQITVENELNAYTIFETLNSRGVELTSTDLLKNYLFSLVAKSSSDLKQVKKQWKKIIDIIGLKDFSTFLRHYLNSKMKLINKGYLFKAIKLTVKEDEDVFSLLDSLEESAYIYIALGNPNDEYWREDKDLIELIDALKLFGVTQHKPLLMISHKYLESKDFKKLLKSLVSISYRYSVIGRHQTNIMDKIYNKASILVYNGKGSVGLSEILNSIKDLYISDDDFKNSFEGKSFNTNNSSHKKQARYTLYKIEGQLQNGNKYDYASDLGTIEHILPENLTEEWEQIFSEDEHIRNIYKIGNFTLLEPNKNRDIADKVFCEKEKVYHTSKYAMTKSIEASEWNISGLKHRQSKLASIACGIWKIQYN
ncbi:MAG: RloF [uncultured Campylobacterales bacterium]|uniref:RloF n=1 Tax=uncultured Campylobacterales bacterium TaxID=352960 RepID=A0A6S6S7W5_9BACT|nr:MAG: RloF [uncultured Campylobacterales bacterium]